MRIGCGNVGISRSRRDFQVRVETVLWFPEGRHFHSRLRDDARRQSYPTGLLRDLLCAQVGVDFGAPAPRSAFEDVRVMEQPIEERRDGGGVTQ